MFIILISNMTLSKVIQDALNEQLRSEAQSVFLFLEMANWLHTNQYYGLAHWMRVQSEEEIGHMLKVIDYIMKRNGSFEIPTIEKKTYNWSTPESVFNDAMEYEKIVTANVNKWSKIAEENADYAYQEFLNFFVKDQVEEEEELRKILISFDQLKDSKDKYFLMDKRLGKRKKKKD